MKMGISEYHEKLAMLVSMKEMPMEMMKKIGTTILRSVPNLIAVLFMFLYIMRLFRLAYNHMSVSIKPAAAWSVAYNATDSCRL